MNWKTYQYLLFEKLLPTPKEHTETSKIWRKTSWVKPKSQNISNYTFYKIREKCFYFTFTNFSLQRKVCKLKIQNIFFTKHIKEPWITSTTSALAPKETLPETPFSLTLFHSLEALEALWILLKNSFEALFELLYALVNLSWSSLENLFKLSWSFLEVHLKLYLSSL